MSLENTLPKSVAIISTGDKLKTRLFAEKSNDFGSFCTDFALSRGKTILCFEFDQVKCREQGQNIFHIFGKPNPQALFAAIFRIFGFIES